MPTPRRPHPRRARPLTDEQRDLAADPESIAVALRVAKKMTKSHPEQLEEATRAALYGLVLAAGRFDASRKVPWVAYLIRRTTGAILDACRQSGPLGYRRWWRDRRRWQDAPRIGSLHVTAADGTLLVDSLTSDRSYTMD